MSEQTMAALLELPQGWRICKVGELAEAVQPGFPYGQYNTEGKGVPHLRPMNVDAWGRIALDEVKFVDVDYPPLLQPGDVLFNNTNSPVWVGKTAVICSSQAMTFSNHMTRIRFKSSVCEPAFFAYQLHYLQQTGYFEARCNNHVNQASISSSYLSGSVDVVVPPLAERAAHRRGHRAAVHAA